jgi:two-component system, chemotaxis family, protein-glutamate methylesterase/glutaminase
VRTAPLSQRLTPGAPLSAIRVLIVDDSAVARAMLARAVQDHDRFTVVAALDSAERALHWLRAHQADIILLDINMPGRSGLAALPELITAGGWAQIVIVSSCAAEGATATLQALSLGATDAIAKPDSGIGRHFGALLTERLLRMVSEGTAYERRGTAAVRIAGSDPVSCVAIGASTGGIHALTRFFRELPVDFAAPIFVTQHLPPSFMTFFADQLAVMARRPACVARDGMIVAPGQIHIAPGLAHLTCQRAGKDVEIRLSADPAPSRCMPSVDPMFASVARTYGKGAVGIVLSGMGKDGTQGSVVMAAAGASVIVQDAESSVVWGMPGSIATAGLACLIASPDQLAAHLIWRGCAR